MKTIICLAITAVLLWTSPAHAVDYNKQTIEQLKSNIEKKHPSAYYILAAKLFQANKKDEAILWFYIGQLRFRYHIAANPDLDPSGDKALFASLSSVIGSPLNEYAFGDIPTLSKTMTKALDWDKTHENNFTPKDKNKEQYAHIRSGLKKLNTHILDQQESIKKQRLANGLKNRS